MRSLLVLLLAGCAQIPRGASWSPGWEEEPPPRQPYVVQALIGVQELDGSSLAVDGDVGEIDSDDQTLPLLGAAVQRPVRGGSLQIGMEAGVTTAWDDDEGRAVVGGDELATETEVWLVDAFAGIFANKFLARGFRVYAAVGPLLQWGSVELKAEDDDGGFDLDDSGIGVGFYARAGFEIPIFEGSSAGLGVRWVSSSVDLGGGLDDLDVDSLQLAFTMTSGF